MSEISMVERVARAIYGATPRNKPYSLLTKFKRDALEVEARAAIEVMREDDLKQLLTERKFQSQYSLTEGGCWEWQGAVDRRDGYGRFYDGAGKTISAHQFAYRMSAGDVPRGMVIDHICRNRTCVNPDHLRVVTNAENVLCGVGVTAKNANKELCCHGHELDGDNLYVRPNGERDCKSCRLEASRRFKAKKRAMALAGQP